MFITEVVSKGKRGKIYTSILLRESVRVGPTVKSKTLAVLTHLPAPVLAAVRQAVAQPADSLAELAASANGALQLRQAESFGAVWTADQIARQLGLPQALGVTPAAALSYWQVLARVLRPGGVACVATEFIMEGGQHGEYFTADDLHHWILAASPELELVEPIDFTPPDRRFFDDPVHLPDDPLHTPHVVLAIDRWRFTSIVLFFAKRRSGPSGLRSRARRLLGT